MNSVWVEHCDMPHYESLAGSIKTDVLIIGGGMAGVLCARFLQEKSVDYTLVEGRTIGSGITKDTTAKITAQHGLLYAKLLRTKGEETVRKYLDVNLQAVQKYTELCKQMDCDFETKTSYIYSRNDRKKLEEEADALRKIGYDALMVQNTGLPIETVGAIGFEDQGQFHPLKFMAGLARGLNIYEHTFVKEFKDHTAVTDHGNIVFQKVIFATHFPIDNKHGMYFLKLYQHRSYVIALEHAADVDGMYLDAEKGGFSFRNYGNLLLLGGGSHRTGKSGGNWQQLYDFAGKHYPGAIPRYAWATQDCMSLDGIAYIGAYAKHMQDCYVATGVNKWGMTSSMVSAMILTDLVMEKENPYAEVFDPARSMWTPQLFCNGWEAFTNLLTISKKRCPHLGCALKWNSEERSWDCPCHGWRFAEDGTLIDNPANGDLH